MCLSEPNNLEGTDPLLVQALYRMQAAHLWRYSADVSRRLLEFRMFYGGERIDHTSGTRLRAGITGRQIRRAWSPQRGPAMGYES